MPTKTGIIEPVDHCTRCDKPIAKDWNGPPCCEQCLERIRYLDMQDGHGQGKGKGSTRRGGARVQVVTGQGEESGIRVYNSRKIFGF